MPNPQFPVDKSTLPLPSVSTPAVCAEVIGITLCVPGAIIRIIANGTESLGEDVATFGDVDIKLKRRLKALDSLAITQTVDGVESQPTILEILSEIPSLKGTITFGSLYECSRIVALDGLVPGVRIHVFQEDSGLIGTAPVAGSWQAIFTTPLTLKNLSVQQVACEGTVMEFPGPLVAGPPVTKAPIPLPSPDPDPVILGNNVVTLRRTLTGAAIEIQDRGTVISSGFFATGDATYFPVDPLISESSKITATQELCDQKSLPSDSDHDPVSDTLRTPVVLGGIGIGAICDGEKAVSVGKTVVGATVVISVNDKIVGFGPGALDVASIHLGPGLELHNSDFVTAIQFIGPIISKESTPPFMVGCKG